MTKSSSIPANDFRKAFTSRNNFQDDITVVICSMFIPMPKMYDIADDIFFCCSFFAHWKSLSLFNLMHWTLKGMHLSRLSPVIKGCKRLQEVADSYRSSHIAHRIAEPNVWSKKYYTLLGYINRYSNIQPFFRK